ncbi:DUF4124 domain-containing protein [Alteromonas sp. ASW11-36]|uniref:DUF4124 domain-containing protein n=1 Tax=Alteromonas arenosi TaxID=3055817 RepID=A0ABT7T229_9ALTE|nr:DUF4124 domain-containing protein [Alteromonas sp. ASW11-36]MDM7861839.1 DUF4124 domain-containing protein [Alteromonas sp. ASW11-36]
MKSLIITAIAVALTASISAQTVYKVVAKDGSVTFTDTPVPGSEPISLSKVTIAEPLATPTPPPPPKRVEQIPKPSISILAPSPEATIRNNLGTVSISSAISPAIPGRFELVLDGNPVESNTTGTFELADIDRGEHNYQIHFINNTGKILASTPVQTFYMHKASALINP